MLGEYLSFRRMITPVFIQVIFWIAVVAVVIVGIAQLTQGGAEGILVILLGPFLVRIYAEILIVIFRINEDLAAIRAGKETPTAPPMA